MNDISNVPKNPRPGAGHTRFEPDNGPSDRDDRDDRDDGSGGGEPFNWRALIDRIAWEVVMFLKSLSGPVVLALLALLYIDALAVGNHASFWAGFLPTRAPISLADTPIIGWALPDENPYTIAAFMAGLLTVILPAILWYLVFSRSRYGTWRDIFLDRNVALLFAISLIGYLVLSYFEFGIFAEAIATKKSTILPGVIGQTSRTFTPEESQIIAAGLVAVNALLAALTGYLFSRVKS